MSLRMSSARDLAAKAQEMGASVWRGKLEPHESGGWDVDGVSVEEWLAEFDGQQVYLVAVAAGAVSTAGVGRRTCRTCGRDYEGAECLHCREARIRLRGR